MPTLPPPANPGPRARLFAAALGLLMLSVLARLPLLEQSLWYDEIVTLRDFVRQPWHEIVAGAYSPNNHILHSLLAKASIEFLGAGAASELALRLPALLAGSLIGIALAWPLRRNRPLLAVGIALCAAVHPWLVSISTEARGYSLALLFAILATNALASALHSATPRKINLPYILAIIAAICTLPIAGLVLIAHLIAVAILFRTRLAAAALSAAIALAGAAALYVPQFAGARAYFAQPHPAFLSYARFAGDLGSSAALGMTWGAFYPAGIAALALICFAAIRLARRTPAAFTALSFTLSGGLVVLAAALLPGAAEVRFAVWLAPIGIFAMVFTFDAAGAWLLARRSPPPSADSAAPSSRGARTPSKAATRAATARAISTLRIRTRALLLSPALLAMCCVTTWQTPLQPIREAVDQARALADKTGGAVIGIWMASAEARIYGNLDAVAYALHSSAEEPGLAEAEASAGARPIYAIVFFEERLHRQTALWDYFQKHYRLVRRLDGRVSPVAIYERVTAP